MASYRVRVTEDGRAAWADFAEQRVENRSRLFICCVCTGRRSGSEQSPRVVTRRGTKFAKRKSIAGWILALCTTSRRALRFTQ